MRLKSIFVFTHDSIFLGEDGPTHQPVEHLDSLRAMPNLAVWRPADGVETAMAWAWIAQLARGPSLLALTRQKVKALDRRAPFHPEDVWRGGYAVQDPGDQTAVVLVATGSEVRLACDTAEKLRGEGVPARVVSLPCLSLFLEQPEEYRNSLIPNDGTPLVAVEAARGESLRVLVGADGLVHGVPGFGSSAPFADLAAHFGFTPDQLAAKVLSHVRGADA
jgi:transketolase